jgi:glycosyltransferase involved in cell wall biosynthesis
MKKILKPTSIDQLLPCYAGHDAIGTHVTSIHKLLVERGFKSNVFSEIIGKNVPVKAESSDQYFDNYQASDSIVIYHYSTGSMIPWRLFGSPAFKVTNYHNITPPNYFSSKGEEQAKAVTRHGRMQMPVIKMCTDATWTESQYNADEIESFGYPRSDLFPILRDFKALSNLPVNSALLEALKGNKKNVLFVGRVAPNKAPHDLFFLLKQYKKFIDPNIRLILVGFSQSPYAQVLLKELAKNLDLSLAEDLSPTAIAHADILMPGQVSDVDLATIYRASDVFTCLSDHEGFCVPLVESMYFGIPIIAHNATAVPETLGSGGLIVEKNNMVATIEGLNALLNSKEVSQHYRKMALDRSNRYNWSTIVSEFDAALDKTLQTFSDSRCM